MIQQIRYRKLIKWDIKMYPTELGLAGVHTLTYTLLVILIIYAEL